MKRVIALLIIFVLSVSTSVCTVFANEQINVNVRVSMTTDSETGEIVQRLIVNGKFPLTYASKKVLVTVVKKNVNLDSDEIADIDKFAAFRQGIIKNDGSFEISELFNADAGEYIVNVSADTLKTPIKNELYITSVDKINELLTNLKDQNITKEGLANILSNEAKEYGIDDNIFKTLADETKKQISHNIIKELEEFTIDAFSQVLEKNIVICGMSDAKSKEDIIKISDYYRQQLDFANQELFADFNELKNKEIFYNGMVNDTYVSIEEIKQGFNNNVVYANLKSVVSATQIRGIVKKYQSQLEFDPENVTYIKYLPNIEKYLITLMPEFKTFKSIKDKLVYAVNNSSTLFPVTKPTPTPGGGGGGGGGGNSTSVGIDPDVSNEDVLDKDFDNDQPIVIFKDIADDFWGKEAITHLYANGVISGNGEGLFLPDNSVTRAEFLKMLVTYMGFRDKGEAMDFVDVSSSDWFYEFVSIGYCNKIILMNNEKTFNPNSQITREDATLLINRALIAKSIAIEKVKNVKFADEETISSYALEAVKALSEAEIIKGFTDNTFKPQNSLTRAESAQLIYNIKK